MEMADSVPTSDNCSNAILLAEGEGTYRGPWIKIEHVGPLRCLARSIPKHSPLVH